MLAGVVQTGKAWGRRQPAEAQELTWVASAPRLPPWPVVVPGLARVAAAWPGDAGSGARHGLDGGARPAAVRALPCDRQPCRRPSRTSCSGGRLSCSLVGGVLAGLSIWRHRTMTRVRMDAALRTVSEVHAARRPTGRRLARRALSRRGRGHRRWGRVDDRAEPHRDRAGGRCRARVRGDRGVAAADLGAAGRGRAGRGPGPGAGRRSRRRAGSGRSVRRTASSRVA